MNIKEIKEMLKVMDENGLVELEVEKDGMKLRFKKESKSEVVTRIERPVEQVKEEIPRVLREPPKNLVEIKAPMVGTFYRAPAPNAPPFVEVGGGVVKEQVVCIIEAMKLMNEIKSEVKGRIAEILVENGDPIEFGQVLFLIEPT